jgi:TPP-dependent pyruvate/acetoin dehydrogenase alpha subunit
MKKLLVEAFGWTAEEDQAVYQSVTQQVDAAVTFGMESPAMKVEDMLNHLFEEGSV